LYLDKHMCVLPPPTALAARRYVQHHEGVDAVGMNPRAEAEGPAAVAEGAACLEFPDVALSQEIELACLRVEGV